MANGIRGQAERYMDLLAERQRLVASNLANIDTPGYKTKDIDFQFEFMSLADGGKPQVIEVPDLPTHNDGNNVSLDRETRLLAEDSLRFNLAASLVMSHLKMKRMAIHEGNSNS
jgi:flagellar basal-body rod protein FlgB